VLYWAIVPLFNSLNKRLFKLPALFIQKKNLSNLNIAKIPCCFWFQGWFSSTGIFFNRVVCAKQGRRQSRIVQLLPQITKTNSNWKKSPRFGLRPKGARVSKLYLSA